MNHRLRRDVLFTAIPLILLLGAFLAVVLRTAWLCDDAYITFRTIDNFLNGYGLRWNVAERVQSYSHPLWMLALIPLHGLAGEAFYSTMLFSTALSLATAILLTFGIATSRQGAALGLLLCMLSTAFVEFSTSGLENPLSHFLAAVLLALCFREQSSPKHFGLLVCVASLIAVTRHDHLLLFLPLLIVEFVAVRSWRAVAWGAIGLLPFFAWELFSLAYYGFFVPNTAYAKLGAGASASSLIMQGMRYLAHAARHDPLTPAACCAAVVFAWRSRGRKMIAVAAGLLLYCMYIVRIGGDFMSGRFLSLPFFVAVALITRLPWRDMRRSHVAALSCACALGLLATYPPLLSGPRFGSDVSQEDVLGAIQIRNERLFSYPALGLCSALKEQEQFAAVLFRARENAGKELRGMDVETVRSTVAAGVTPYHAGPKAHFVDILGLCDPLMARLPIPDPNRWVIGHFRRNVPKGYMQSALSEAIHIEDAGIAAYYARLRVITREPVWRWRRFATILQMHLGHYDGLIAHLWQAR